MMSQQYQLQSQRSVGLTGKAFVSLLNLLPFNGEKTKLAGWVALIAFVQVLTGYDLGIGVDPSIALPVSLTAAVLFFVQRILKGKLGLDKYGDPKLPAGWGNAI